jgi:hypothetical protein
MRLHPLPGSVQQKKAATCWHLQTMKLDGKCHLKVAAPLGVAAQVLVGARCGLRHASALAVLQQQRRCSAACTSWSAAAKPRGKHSTEGHIQCSQGTRASVIILKDGQRQGERIHLGGLEGGIVHVVLQGEESGAPPQWMRSVQTSACVPAFCVALRCRV